MRHSNTIGLSALGGVVLIACLGVYVSAQAPGLALKVEVSLIPLDVAVYDSRGNPVNTLTREDFLIYEEGVLQDIQHFDAADAPYHVLLLFDTSGSTRNQVPFMIEAVNRFFMNMGLNDQVAVASFDVQVAKLLDWRTRGGPSRQIALTPRNAGTDFYGALRWAVGELGRIGGRKGALVLTDGIDQRLSLPSEEAEFQRTLRAVEQSQSPFYFIAVYPGGSAAVAPVKARQRMEQVAQRSGGRVLFPTTLGDVAPLYERIARELGSSYTLAYGSNRPQADGTYRRINVTLKRPGLRVSQSRTGYYAGGQPAPASDAVAAAVQRSLGVASPDAAAVNVSAVVQTQPATEPPSISDAVAASVRRSLGTDGQPPVSEAAIAQRSAAAEPQETASKPPASLRPAGPQPPVLITPIEHALLSPPELNEWRFDWEDVPNARRYQIVVNVPDAAAPIIDEETRGSTYALPRRRIANPTQNSRGWAWKVRAQTADGAWGAWSESRQFDVFVSALAR
jgi:Ca-activated chloride channel family protein